MKNKVGFILASSFSYCVQISYRKDKPDQQSCKEEEEIKEEEADQQQHMCKYNVLMLYDRIYW